MNICPAHLHQVFFRLADEHLAAMETLLLEIDSNSADPADFTALFHYAHSIVGIAAACKVADMREVAQACEALIDPIRQGRLELRSELVDLLLATTDVLKLLLAAHSDGMAVDPHVITKISRRLEQLAASQALSAPDWGAANFRNQGREAWREVPTTGAASRELVELSSNILVTLECLQKGLLELQRNTRALQEVVISMRKP